MINNNQDLSKTIPTSDFMPKSEQKKKKIYQATKANPIPHEQLVNDPIYWIEGLGYHFWLDAYNNDIGLWKF